MGYTAELRTNWRPLSAALIGMGSGMSAVGMITSIIAPNLVAYAQWPKAQFAMVGTMALLTAIAFPFIGRLADVIGVRMTALIGQVSLPFIYLAFSLVGEYFWVYVAIFAVQSVICVTTTATVYSRLAVEYVKTARGLALAIVASGPAITGVLLAPLLNFLVEEHGWRAAYQAVAMFSVVAGFTTFMLTPRSADAIGRGARPRTSNRKLKADYRLIFRSKAFWILLVVLLLCNLPQTILLVQLKMLLLENGVSGEGVSFMVSMLSVGMLAGRFLTGLALDRYVAKIVAFVTLGLPSLGLFVFASSFDAPAVLTAAVFCLGFAFGAEGDIVGFLVARSFALEIYSSVMGLLTCAMSISVASGAALLSYTMSKTGGFDQYLIVSGTCVLLGAVLILLLPARPKTTETVAPPEADLPESLGRELATPMR